MGTRPEKSSNDQDTSLSLYEVSEIYERVREKIEHEDTLISQRLSWLLTSQGFFLWRLV